MCGSEHAHSKVPRNTQNSESTQLEHSCFTSSGEDEYIEDAPGSSIYSKWEN